jgi:ABC-2 type transport system ATP-binding protein
MTVRSFLLHIGKLKGMNAGELSKRLPEVLALTDLVDREHQVIQTLSHGYRKRVGIAQAIIHDPKLVILDEPISGLDPAQIVEMRDVIRGLGKDRAVMLSSHILKEISMTCDRVIVIHKGRMASTVELGGDDAGPERIMLTVRADADALRSWATSQPQVAQYNETQNQDGLVTAVVDLTGDIREDFLAEVAKAGFGIRLVERPIAELETLFLSVIQEEVAA